MYEIRIEEGGQELLHKRLVEGTYNLGRSQDNEISIQRASVSRYHLRLEVSSAAVKVTDLGSTNGTNLNGQKLVPNRTTNWDAENSLTIGSLNLALIPIVEQSRSPSIPPPVFDQSSSPAAGLVPIISSGQTTPASYQLDQRPVIAGSDLSCGIRINAGNVASHHCVIQQKKGRVYVTSLDGNHPAELGNVPLTLGAEQEWTETKTLQIGDAFLSLSYSTEQSTFGYKASRPYGTQSRFGGWWRYGVALIVISGIAVICLGAAAFIGAQRSDCAGLDISCIFSSLTSGDQGGTSGGISGRATPTLQPTTVGKPPPTRADTIEFGTTTPIPTAAMTTECSEGESIAAGWLELPFPYQGTDPVFGGTAEGFKRISQRSRFGGRINSFFDHEFPVYPPAFGGREPVDLADSLVTFNGSRSPDAFSQDSEGADWYSGHSGIDFSPSFAREATTPVLAAAEGRLLLAKIDSDGNHMVWLDHDPDGDGRYQYATLYFHFTPDEFFSAMVAMDVGTPISAGQRIGTMGTTGRSSGVHLHFEVRNDINNDGQFSMFERVDPYGFFPTEEFPADPWELIVSWLDSKGGEIDHPGIKSEYLWKHPLVDVVGTTTECVQVRGEQVDLNLYPVLGFAVVNSGFTYIAGQDEQGNTLRKGEPQLRRITVLPEYLDGVDTNSVRLEYLDPVLGIWIAVDQNEATFTPKPDGSWLYSAKISNTGRYVLVGRETEDRVPPVTTVLFSGERGQGEGNVFKESVEITLSPRDKGILTSPILETQYSLDCGKNWTIYTEPFLVTSASPHECGQQANSSETIALNQNDFLLLAMSEDSKNNIEQPPAQVRFTIEE